MSDGTASVSQQAGDTSPIILTKRSKDRKMKTSSTMKKKRSSDSEDEEPERKRRRKEPEKQGNTTLERNITEENKNTIIIEELPDVVETPNIVMDPDVSCPLCVLMHVSRNIQLFVGKIPIITTIECSGECIRVNDAMETFVSCFFHLVRDLKTLKVKTMSSLKTNFSIFSEHVLNKTGGSYSFYCQVLENLADLNSERKNRMVRILNEITESCLVNHVKEFENELSKRRQAKKNLVKCLSETGAIKTVLAVLQAMHKMHMSGVSLLAIIPPSLSMLVDEFNTAPGMSSNMAYHTFLINVSRKVIKKVFHENKLIVLEITKKVYIHDEFETNGKAFIYFDKVDKNITHFLDINELICAKNIDLNSIMFNGEENCLESDDWKFFLKLKQQHKLGMIAEVHDKTTAAEMIDTHETSIDEEGDEKAASVKECKAGDDGELDSSFDSAKEEAAKTTIEESFVIEADKILKYWNPISLHKRKFHAHLVGSEWPSLYRSVCCVVLDYNHVKKFQSRKRNDDFAKLIGICTICKASHTYNIVRNPFDEQILEDGRVQYNPARNMIVDVTVQGRFFSTDDKPDISKPLHYKKKARGKFLKGRERELIGIRATQIGPVPTYLEQYAFAKENEIEFGNRNSIRSLPVIKGAKSEQDKKVRGGSTHYESAKSAIDLLASDIESPNFPATNASKKLPGIVRSLQEIPFKITIANFDMLKIAAYYFSNVLLSILCLDSSGKYWQEKNKAGKDLLNSALVFPPLARGLTPFAFFEMVSRENKTLDFVEMLQRAWGHMATANNDKPVKEPSIAVTDISFPNIHAILTVFNRVKLPAYLEQCYAALMNNDDFPFPTKVSVCENHLIPVLLKSAREVVKDKMIADTCVAGLLLVLRAPTITRALEIWNNLVMVHCSKNVNQEARRFITKISKKEALEDFTENDSVSHFGVETPDDELATYGNRESMRSRSPFNPLFKKPVIKVKKQNETIKNIENELYAPEFCTEAAKQFLPLYPFFSAAFLEDGLMTNAHVELHWRNLRAQMSRISKAQQWPAVLLGHRHQQTRRQAKEILMHSLIPNLKFGGKNTAVKATHIDLMQELSRKPFDKKFFRPSGGKKKRTTEKINTSYDGSKERWGPKASQSTSSKKENYIKGKQIDHEAIQSLVRSNAGKLRVTGNENQGIILTKQDIIWIETKNAYISDNAVDCGLLLLDKRINDESNTKMENINIYSIQRCRIILGGEVNEVKQGKFVAIIPRHMAFSDTDDFEEARKEGKESLAANAGHYTLVSNLFCKDNECNIFETFGPYKNVESLVTDNGKQLIKYLCNASKTDLKLNCIEVVEQEESECGALAFALALQLCFFYHEEGLNMKFKDVRKHLLACLKSNELVDFPHGRIVDNNEIVRVLFSINI